MAAVKGQRTKGDGNVQTQAVTYQSAITSKYSPRAIILAPQVGVRYGSGIFRHSIWHSTASWASDMVFGSRRDPLHLELGGMKTTKRRRRRRWRRRRTKELHLWRKSRDPHPEWAINNVRCCLLYANGSLEYSTVGGNLVTHISRSSPSFTIFHISIYWGHPQNASKCHGAKPYFPFWDASSYFRVSLFFRQTHKFQPWINKPLGCSIGGYHLYKYHIMTGRVYPGFSWSSSMDARDDPAAPRREVGSGRFWVSWRPGRLKRGPVGKTWGDSLSPW